MSTLVKLAILFSTPSLIAGAVLWLPRLVRGLLARLRRGASVRPVGPPLEQTAASLRRLLAEHAAVRSSADVAVRAKHLAALDGALTDCALDAVRALGLPEPVREGRSPLPREALRALLADLAREGVVLPGHERYGR